ncbi:MAG: B12-binding domain-containing radical SAM protein [Planctomycetes bacterium]|nr:B12-binding domain-containing radical SAM protein [Planctomycetota bacterium]
MRIQLIQPAGEIHRHRSGIFKRSLRYAPLTLPTLAALVPDELEAEIALQDEGVQPLDLEFEADLVGLSAITGTAPRTYAIADELRARGHTVVIGGVHATLLPDEAAQHADAVVVSYAEESWPRLLRDFATGRLQPRYFAPTGRVLNVPIARRDLLKRNRYVTTNSIEATRGCPHRCEFCAVPAAWGGIYAHRPIADVIAELETFEKRHAVFIDLSPVEDTRHAKELYQAMIPLGIRWLGLATTRIAEDEELLRLAARSGCKGLLIGFESVDQPTLDGIQKPFHRAGRFAEIVKKLHDHGIAIQGCFVFGFDTDDESVFERTVEFVDRAKIDLPRYAVMTPFPGTAAYRQLQREGRLLHENWSLYDVEHVVFQPRQMSPERLQEGLHWAWQQSYRWRSIFSRVLGSRCLVPLSLSLNIGYRFYAKHLPEKARTVYRDEEFIAAAVRGQTLCCQMEDESFPLPAAAASLQTTLPISNLP